MRRALSFLRNMAVIAIFFGVVAAVAFGTWRFMPEESRVLFRDPASVARSAERGVRSGPANPLASFGEWLTEKMAELQDTSDVLVTADGTSGGIAPLPGWTSTDISRFFGATESIWQPRRAKLAGVRWSRVVFFWSEVQPRQRDWRAQHYLPDRMIKRERDNGVEVVGLLMNTPTWAASDPRHTVRSVPSGLDRPVDDPQNVWASYVRRMAYDYRGRIDTWVIWNEPDIRPQDDNALYHSWAGDAGDYARLLRVAYLAAKQGNPNARVVFAATTYWGDTNSGRPLFLERTLAALAENSESAKHHFYFDAVALNLYTSPDDLGRVAGIYRSVLARFGLDAPLWITETNAIPYDDASKGLRRDQNGLRVTMDQQASYVVQAFAMGMVAGFERMAFHSVMDRSTDDEVWGLLRNDGTLRPAFVAYQTAARYFGGASARFVGVERADWRWPRGGYVPNWQFYLVALDRPDGQRVSVLWNGDGVPLRITLPKRSENAALLDKYGRPAALERDGDRWVITLPAATAHSPIDPEGYYFVGGDPLLLIEQGVAPDSPLDPPSLLG
ncbi:MAG TPA: DUF5722 domain-containing protein [Chloroflexota bacterium]|nr:DUF5722 domain-containing protein [Chloroflexota bacterium]